MDRYHERSVQIPDVVVLLLLVTSSKLNRFAGHGSPSEASIWDAAYSSSGRRNGDFDSPEDWSHDPQLGTG